MSRILKDGKQFTIAIEGNIASGKSTLLDYLQSVNKAQVVEEPVYRWQHVVDGENGNLIERMYRDPKRWSYLFQSYVLLTMLEAHDVPQTNQIKVMERSVYSARYCFIENLRKSTPPLLEELEYEVYTRWFDWLMEHKRPKVDLIVYLRTDPEVCMERLKRRGRHEESTVALSYLQTLHERYEDWLIRNPAQHGGNVPVLVLDGNKDSLTYEQLHNEFSTAITNEIERTQTLRGVESAASSSPKRPLQCRELDATPGLPAACRPRSLFADGSEDAAED